MASTLFCSDADQEQRTQLWLASANVKIIVCGASGDVISADVTIEPVLKEASSDGDSNDLEDDGDDNANGANLFSAMCLMSR